MKLRREREERGQKRALNLASLKVRGISEKPQLQVVKESLEFRNYCFSCLVCAWIQVMDAMHE